MKNGEFTEMICRQEDLDALLHENHLTDSTVMEEALQLNDRMGPMVVLFVLLTVAGPIVLAPYIQWMAPELAAILSMAAALAICFLLYKGNEKLCRSHILSRTEEFSLEKGEFIRLTRDFQRPKRHRDSYSYTIRARLENGKRVKCTIWGREADTYDRKNTDFVYVLAVPRHPRGFLYRIYNPRDFQNHCRNIRLN